VQHQTDYLDTVQVHHRDRSRGDRELAHATVPHSVMKKKIPVMMMKKKKKKKKKTKKKTKKKGKYIRNLWKHANA
jgi:hypothetical protein